MPLPAADVGAPATAMHASAADITVDAYASLVSQYVYRGVALRDRPTGSVAMSVAAHGWFVDLWSGRVDGDAQTYYGSAARNTEWDVDASIGYGAAITDSWQASFAAARIIDARESDGPSHDYDEWRASVFYRDVVRAQFAYSEDYLQRGWNSWNAELAGSHSLTGPLSGEWGIGRSHGVGRAGNDYEYGWLGLFGILWRTQWDVRWVDSTHGARYVLDSASGGSRVTVSLSWGVSVLP